MRALFVIVVAIILAVPGFAQQNQSQQSSQPDSQSANQQKKKEKTQPAMTKKKSISI